VKISVKKCTFLALLAVVLLTGWEGLGAGFSTDSGQQILVPPAHPAIATLRDNDDSKAVTDISPAIPDFNLPIEQSSRNILFTDSRWTLEQINYLSSIKIKNTEPVLIAVLDTGIDALHEDLAGKVAAEMNFSSSGTANDVYGHGTSVAGIIAADAENDIGINGIAPAALLLNVKVADDSGRCKAEALAQGIIWAADNGAQVINISLEIRDYSNELQEAVDYAWEKGAVIIAAAGNDGSSTPVYPAAFDNCLAVTAVKDDNTPVPLANYGDWVNVAAPGYKIYTALPGNSYGYRYGTSFAAACISGLAGELFAILEDSNDNGRLNDEVRQAIEAGYGGFLSK
jgi:thermitase